MFNYNFTALNKVFNGLLEKNLTGDSFSWLKEKAASDTPAQFNTAFVSLPRKTGKSLVQFSDDDTHAINTGRPGLDISGWTVDRFARVWLLMQKDANDKDKYFKEIEALFGAAEINELVALYSALPVLAYPSMWAARCAEGIRNNIADVLAAIMCNNPYPSENLNEPAWNQLVLKAIFTEKPVEEIVELDKRTNAELAEILSDYAHERWAAGRSVNPQLWRCVAPHINEKILPDLQRIAESENPLEREAAALATYYSPYEPAKKYLRESFRKKIESGELTWNILAQKTKVYVLQ